MRRKYSEICLLEHDGSSFVAEFTNTLYARRRVNGQFTVFAWGWNPEWSARGCWVKNIKTPEEFVQGCLDVLDSVDLGGMGLYELFHEGLPDLKKLDAEFAEKVRQYLLEEHGEEYFEESDRDSELTTRTYKVGRVTVTELSPQDAIAEYGASMSFVGGPFTR